MSESDPIKTAAFNRIKYKLQEIGLVFEDTDPCLVADIIESLMFGDTEQLIKAVKTVDAIRERTASPMPQPTVVQVPKTRKISQIDTIERQINNTNPVEFFFP